MILAYGSDRIGSDRIGSDRMKMKVIAVMLMFSSLSWGAIPTNSVGTGAAQGVVPSGSGRLSLTATAELIASSGDCNKVCSQVRARILNQKPAVAEEYKIWKERLGVKGDTIMYLRGYSATEELLKFMSSYYVTRAPEGQMEPAFLTNLMGKCFPKSFVDIDHARLSGLVDTVWAAKTLRVEKAINSCK